jgi:small subunit ribosomal protein S21
MQREGIFREMKLRGHYEKPSEKKTREKAEAIRRARKLGRKKMQHDGLLASLGDRVEDIEQVARGSSEPIQPCYHQHVTVTDAFDQQSLARRQRR